MERYGRAKMKKLVVRWIRDGTRRVGWAFLAGFSVGGVFMWGLWKMVVGKGEDHKDADD